MLNVVIKLCQAVDLAVRTCAGMLSTVEACLLFQQHLCLVECERDLICFGESLRGLMEIFAWLIPIPKFYLVGTDEVMKVC